MKGIINKKALTGSRTPVFLDDPTTCLSPLRGDFFRNTSTPFFEKTRACQIGGGMKRFFYFAGRTLQLAGLLILPSALWAAEFQKSEARAVTLLVGSIGLFFLGWFLQK